MADKLGLKQMVNQVMEVYGGCWSFFASYPEEIKFVYENMREGSNIRFFIVDKTVCRFLQNSFTDYEPWSKMIAAH